MRCPYCLVDKLDNDFPKRNGKPRKDCCKSCRNERAQERYRENPRKYAALRRKYQIKNKYGISEKYYEEMLANQLGVCAICRGLQTNGNDVFDIDHCHETGEIRGLLCHKCNMGLGSYDDDIKKLERAITYLERYQKNG